MRIVNGDGREREGGQEFLARRREITVIDAVELALRQYFIKEEPRDVLRAVFTEATRIDIVVEFVLRIEEILTDKLLDFRGFLTPDGSFGGLAEIIGQFGQRHAIAMAHGGEINRKNGHDR